MIIDVKFLKDLLDSALIKHNIPGLAVAIDYEGQNIFSLGLGTASVTKNRIVRPDTIFGVASLTKILTTLILLKAEEFRLIMLSNSLSNYYPDLRWLHKNDISLKNLLNHSAGLPGLATRHKAKDLNYPNGNFQIENVTSLVKYLNTIDFKLLGRPGQLLSYSNESYCLLGGIIEQVFKKPYKSVAEELVLRPLKMRNSFIGGVRDGGTENIADPIDFWHNEKRERGNQYWDAPLFYPAGGLMSSATDINKLVSALCGNSNFLKSDQYNQVAFDPMSIASRPNAKFAYGLGIEIEYICPEKTLLWHTGQRPGIASFVGQIIQDRLSVALLTNVTDAPTSKIGREVFSHLLSKNDIPVNLFWPPEISNIQFETKNLDNFVGIYGSQEVGEYKVYLQDGKILMQFINSTNEMLLKKPTSGIVGAQTFKFMFNGDPKPYALALDLRLLRRLK